MHLPSSSGTCRGPVSAVIFDWAGTVLDFGCMAPVGAFRQVFDEAGLPIDIAEAREPMGAAKREHIAMILAMPAVKKRWIVCFGAEPVKADVDRLYTRFLEIDPEHVEKHHALIPGALDTIAALRRRDIRIGSTTGYPHEVMTYLAPMAAARGYVPDHCTTVSDVPRGRPWPDMCLDNALALQVPDVRSCVVVDDSPSGLAAGRAAGMWAVGIAASGNEVGLSLEEWQATGADERARRIAVARGRLEKAGAHLVVDSIADLMPAIERIDGWLAEGRTP
ncbi:phosphonoacetaldehyde hydrolase [Luteibacter anthropi]|uniref:phosphonoacetaldehyde hydrolase n=1 Tax=Luteibacter anthropi TaxID=564369 RepID=UPI00203244CE|nr:phosphonoacetaldehyde hydrolase [Luteibacter anthropi]URX61827.1 phosphonoacetaldehyde hydrolase [Luteibacter anthropi]